jgi:hypothetical protein
MHTVKLIMTPKMVVLSFHDGFGSCKLSTLPSRENKVSPVPRTMVLAYCVSSLSARVDTQDQPICAKSGAWKISRFCCTPESWSFNVLSDPAIWVPQRVLLTKGDGQWTAQDDCAQGLAGKHALTMGGFPRSRRTHRRETTRTSLPYRLQVLRRVGLEPA